MLDDLPQQLRPWRWTASLRLDLLAPVIAVAVLFAIVVGNRLATYHGNATGFILIGQHFVGVVAPPHGALIKSPVGYDGQFFYLQAKDPLLLHDSTIGAFRASQQPFRMQRMAYPTLSYLLAAGQRGAIPWSMLVVNVLVVLLITVAFGAYARARGWSGWWSLGIGLMSGLLSATLRDLSDPLAVATMLAGVMLWQRGRRWWAAGLLSVAVLAREPMLLAMVAIAADAAIRWWRGRGVPGTALGIVREVWPVVVVPTVVFGAWQLYVTARYGGSVSSPSSAFLPPFVGLIDEVRHAVSDPSLRDQVWDLTYLALMAAGILASLWLVWRRATAAGVTALLFGLSLLVLVFGDPWSYTRLSAPMFAVLLLAGLEQRSRPALLVCVAAAAMTVLMPFAPWLGAR